MDKLLLKIKLYYLWWKGRRGYKKWLKFKEKLPYKTIYDVPPITKEMRGSENG